MPIYDYACTQCGRSIEVMHGIDAPRPTTCEVCGGQLKKQVSTPAIHFRGSGWAKRDARSSATKKAEAADSTPTGGSDSGALDGAAASSKTSDAKTSDAKPSEAKPSADGGGSKDTSESKPAAKSTGSTKAPGKESTSKASDSTGSSSTSGS